MFPYASQVDCILYCFFLNELVLVKERFLHFIILTNISRPLKFAEAPKQKTKNKTTTTTNKLRFKYIEYVLPGKLFWTAMCNKSVLYYSQVN